MIDLMPDLPSNVIGLVASGRITAQDYERVVRPAVNKALKTHGKIRLFYHIGPRCTGASAGAVWADLKVGFAHMRAWERVALVTDIAWIRNSIRLFGFTMTGMVRTFGNDQLADAQSWILGA